MSFLKSIILLVIFTNLSCAKKSILFIIVDDFRPAVNALGDSKAMTPNIDKLAKESYVFANVFVQQALCAPSRNSILTGRRPDIIHLYDFYSYWRTFSGNFTTLPQYFKENGYFTYSIGKVFHPGASSNFTDDYPYSWSSPTYHPRSEKYLNEAVCLSANGEVAANLLCPINLNTFPGHILPDIDSTLHAKEILKTNKEPFFLAIGYHKPHIPFQFPSKYLQYHEDLAKFNEPDDNFKPFGMPDVAWNPFADVRKRDDVKKLNITFPFQTLPREFRLKTRQHYYASITYIDDLIGQLLKSVYLKDTIIVLTGDHGWSLGEHTEWAKYSNFEVALKVPLLIYDGGKYKNIQSISESIDIFPTLVELAGLPTIPKCSGNRHQNLCLEGKSLLSNVVANNVAVSQYPRPGTFPTMISDKPRLHQIQIMGYSIRTNQFRYTAWVRFDPKTMQKDWNAIYDEELYDHYIDGGEYMNLANRDGLKPIKSVLLQQLKDKLDI